MPDVPTARELGATSEVPPGHNGLYAPAGLPPRSRRRWSATAPTRSRATCCARCSPIPARPSAISVAPTSWRRRWPTTSSRASSSAGLGSPPNRFCGPISLSTRRLGRRRIKPFQTIMARQAPAFGRRLRMAISLKVNGVSRSVTAEPDTPLLYVLRNDLELNGAKYRLRTGAVRRLHGAGRRQGRALLRDRRSAGSRRARSPPSRVSVRATSCMRCSTPSSRSRRRSAATAPAA